MNDRPTERHELRWSSRLSTSFALLVYRCLHGLAPPYLANELQFVSSLNTRRRLRSAATNALVVPLSSSSPPPPPPPPSSSSSRKHSVYKCLYLVIPSYCCKTRITFLTRNPSATNAVVVLIGVDFQSTKALSFLNRSLWNISHISTTIFCIELPWRILT